MVFMQASRASGIPQIDTPADWTKYVEAKEKEEKKRAAEAVVTLHQPSLPTPELPPTVEESPEETDARAPRSLTRSTADVASLGKRDRQVVDLTGEADEMDLSSDHEVAQDHVDIDLCSDEVESGERMVPDVIEYVMRREFREIPAVEILAICKSAVRFLEDRIDLQKLASYDTSMPSGVYEGKMWQRKESVHVGGRHMLVWYGPSELVGQCGIYFREILTVGGAS